MSYGLLFLLPYLVAAAAIVDAIRVQAPWYWYLIILFFPLMGSIVYFAVSRATGFDSLGRGISRRAQARKRLQALRVQLSHWRGPALLAEAGDELLVLGKTGDAVAHFQEAKENGGSPEDVNLGLARALQLQGNYRDAIPLLTELCDFDPDFKLGEAQLALGRCLDESGDQERAERVFRELLSRRSPFEARVRLARILQRRGASVEAETLLDEIENDAVLLPRYLKRHHRPWIRAAKRLRRGGTKLPKPSVDVVAGVPRRDRPAWAIAGIALVLVAAGAFALYVFAFYWSISEAATSHEERQRLRTELDALDRAHPSPHGNDLAVAEPTRDEIRRYLEIRRALEPRMSELSALEATREALYEGVDFGWLDWLSATNAQSDWYTVRTELDRAVLAELTRHEMGSTHALHLIAMIEWRWLRRSEAMALGLPDYFREDLTLTRATLEADAAVQETFMEGDWESRWRKDYERRLERAREKYAELERVANENVELSETAVTLFEAHRSELTDFDPDGLRYWLSSLDDSLSWP